MTSIDSDDRQAETGAHLSASSSGNTAGRGAAWTLWAAIATFAAILCTVYFYLFPRLYGERVSPAAQISVYAVSLTQESGAREARCTDGSAVFLLGSPLMSALDFSLFRGDGLQQPARLTLYFSDSGRRTRPARKALERILTGVLLPDGSVALSKAEDWGDDRLSFELPGLSPDDANEIFARLTN